MRRLNTSTFLFAALLLAQPALADSDTKNPVSSVASAQPVSSETSAQPVSSETSAQPVSTEAAAEAVSSAPSVERSQPQKQPVRLSRDEICQMIEEAASGEALPFEFLARLIWQESKFNPQAVSPAGAQGIAQFMPKTATGRGLANPFEPLAALHESAEFLRELVNQFGNLGLAAAAYNAGPKRVQDWLAKRGVLPRETQNYVHIITGYRPDKWVASEPPALETAEFKSFGCTEIAKLVAQRRNTAVIERLASLVSQRMSQKSGSEALAPQAHGQALAGHPRSTARNGILAKRGTPPATKMRIEQVAKLVARPGKQPRMERIIKITAQSRNQPRVGQVAKLVERPGKQPRMERIIKITAQSRNQPRVETVSRVADRRTGPDAKAKGTSRPVQVAANLAKGKTAAVSAQKKTAAPVRVAANTHANADKACSAKGAARKSCRAA